MVSLATGDHLPNTQIDCIPFRNEQFFFTSSQRFISIAGTALFTSFFSVSEFNLARTFLFEVTSSSWRPVSSGPSHGSAPYPLQCFEEAPKNRFAVAARLSQRSRKHFARRGTIVCRRALVVWESTQNDHVPVVLHQALAFSIHISATWT